MPRAGKAPVVLPKGAEVNFTGGLLTTKSPLGALVQPIHSLVKVITDNNTIMFALADESREADMLQGMMRTLTVNMVKGVMMGLEHKLSLVGTSYHALTQGTALKLQPGFLYDAVHEVPDGVKTETLTQTETIIKGLDRQKVGQVAAKVRSYRPPEPYKGKSVHYVDKRVILKETKKK